MNYGFVDLRLDAGEGSGDEGFWPSFTDIMTVIVMIFMLAAVVLMVRNMDLIQQLRATMEAERQAALIARTTEEQKDALLIRTDALQQELTELRLHLLRASEERDTAQSRLAEREARISELQERERASGQQLAIANRRAEELETSLASAAGRLKEQAARLSDLQAREQAASQQLQQANARLQATDSELSSARQQIENQDSQLAQMRGEFSDLKVKYDRLVRPARTSAGKFVAEVRYRKAGNTFVYEFRPQTQSDYRSLPPEQLNKQLAELKARNPGKLYVKIIIPADSGLSYNEAWTFTNELLSRYDYYYQ
ncbi:MAG: hypothetical protein LJE84_02010 [Gammaproteobacteria bacterium]|nr:hypothetical protein [Gammaproteobacteria bacterium]